MRILPHIVEDMSEGMRTTHAQRRPRQRNALLILSRPFSAGRAQSAMEYLMTYGWAILIIAVALGALYEAGLFNPNIFINSQCIFPADFSCLSSFMSANGQLTINIKQAIGSPINITAIGCNSNQTAANMLAESPPVYLSTGYNYTFTVNCYKGSAVYSGKLGLIYSGYVIVNYTNLQTGFAQTSMATLVQKVT